ncbi:DUF2599 domain-containing protein [Exiguobacterium sp. SH3S2]|nr:MULTISPECIES: DUF2599 domain-containing protein [unclassified Exiguobacterium]TCI42855.1 DUF2599 domain-containing protein [Exiguobacterium sp. SH3S3]TCI58608.1 DUF2599 domain-containing protein [Exiguobacterium sp. SH3S2]TCI61865.1 DUF2599 domain-containing protein [Exiguobacterium sp. SH3S1]
MKACMSSLALFTILGTAHPAYASTGGSESKLRPDAEVDSIEEDRLVNDTDQLNEIEVFFTNPSVTMTKESDEFSIIHEDSNLEFDKTEEGKVIFRNKEEQYSIENVALVGGVQILYNIESTESPKEYVLDLDITEGSRIIHEDGEYKIVNEKGEVEVFIGSPWAKDSNGNEVETYYEIKDQQLIQHIDYEGTDYPLVADPLFCSDTIDNTASKYTDSNTFSVYPRTCARTYITASYTLGGALLGVFGSTAIGKQMWSEVVADASYQATSTANRPKLKDQFICHAVNPTTIWKSSWNLDTNRPDVSLLDTYKALCNPDY